MHPVLRLFVAFDISFCYLLDMVNPRLDVPLTGWCVSSRWWYVMMLSTVVASFLGVWVSNRNSSLSFEATRPKIWFRRHIPLDGLQQCWGYVLFPIPWQILRMTSRAVILPISCPQAEAQTEAGRKRSWKAARCATIS